MKRKRKYILLGIMLIVMVTGILCLFIYTTNSNKFVSIPELTEYEKVVADMRYDASEINEDVINIAQKYFTNISFSKLEILYENKSWISSHYIGYVGGYGEIVIGMNDIRYAPETYELVFTHEYIHYILHRYGLKDNVLHEGLADVYTVFLNRKESSKIWGMKNEERIPPYSIFTNQILEENNFACLYHVFDENDKMDSFEEILTRLEELCNLDVDYE